MILAATAIWSGLSGASQAADSGWKQTPVIPVLDREAKLKLKARVAAGRVAGLRAGVFAKVGDSNTAFAPNLYGLACREPAGLPLALRRTLARYNRIRLLNPDALSNCRPWTSFSRRSAAAQAGTFSSWSLTRISDLPDTGYLKKPEGCPEETTPLDCELDATRPRYGLLMAGTNDIGMDLAFGIKPGSQIGQRLGRVIRAMLARRVIPVLSTVPPVVPADPAFEAEYDVAVNRINATIRGLSRRWHLPMINLWRALNQPFMVADGLADDGLHLSVAGADGMMVGLVPGPTTLADSVDFRPLALRFGANRHNLIVVRTLARLDRITGDS